MSIASKTQTLWFVLDIMVLSLENQYQRDNTMATCVFFQNAYATAVKLPIYLQPKWANDNYGHTIQPLSFYRLSWPQQAAVHSARNGSV